VLPFQPCSDSRLVHPPRAATAPAAGPLWISDVPSYGDLSGLMARTSSLLAPVPTGWALAGSTSSVPSAAVPESRDPLTPV
jgi:hypothetical protein